jgi:hypothetical protein
MSAKNKRKIFHATMHVTRVEEWFVEAETVEMAKWLLERGQGERAQVGECVQLELTDISE